MVAKNGAAGSALLCQDGKIALQRDAKET